MIKVDQQEKHSRYENGTANLNPETKMFNNKFKFDAAADIAKSILEADVKTKMEALKGDQEKLDKNRNGKLDAQDFKMLRGEKKVNEAEANYQSSYRVGKTANFKPKASDVGQGRKITGKMGKYGKQPDDDNMVEPPPEHKVGDVKTDPSAVVPGHSTMGAKLHLASLPKDAEGNTIHKGARRVNAADLVAKRKAMMSQKNEAFEDTLHPAGAALLKHIKPEHHNLYKAHLTKDVFNGGFGDRHAVLKAAQDAGHLKMDLKKQNEEVEELDESSGYTLKHIKTTKHKTTDDEDNPIDASKKHYEIHHSGSKVGDLVHYNDDYAGHFYSGSLHGRKLPHERNNTMGKDDAHSYMKGVLSSKWHTNSKHAVKESLDERTLTAGETAEKEKIVHGMKKSLKGFKARYGDRAKEVMYATATARAKKE